MEMILERIASALERQVEQHDQAYERHTLRREEDLVRIGRQRADDLARIERENAEHRSANSALLAQLSDAVDVIRSNREDLKSLVLRVAMLEEQSASTRTTRTDADVADDHRALSEGAEDR